MKTSQKILILFGVLIIISIIGSIGSSNLISSGKEFPLINQKPNYYSFSSENQGLHSTLIDNKTEKYPCHSFEEWRSFLLDHYNTTLEELSELPNSSVALLNEEARIYTGWSNGSYPDEEKSLLLQELHNTPRIAFGVFPFTDIAWPQGGPFLTSLFHHTDERLECVISIQNFIVGENVFRIYAYIDWDTSDTDKNYPQDLPDYFYGFADGAISKVFPASGDWLNWLGKYPWDSDLNPNEAWMGPDSERIKTIHTQQGYGAQSYTIVTNPGRVDNQINFVIQIMWRWDEVVGFGLWKPWFKWVTRQTDIYKEGSVSTPFNIYDDDIDPPVLRSLEYNRIVGELEPNLVVTGVVDDYSGFAVYADYYGEIIQGFWIPPSNNFIILLPTDRIGHHDIPIVFTDLDLDRDNDWLASDIYYISYTVQDDDSTPPQLYLTHTGTNTDENPGFIFFSITEDDRGSEATGVLTIEGPNNFLYSQNYYEGAYSIKLSDIEVAEPGEYTVTLFAENNDEDRGEIDEETSEITTSFIISDDDEVKPEIDDIIYPDVIKDNINSFNIRVSATDGSGIQSITAEYEGNAYHGIYNVTDGYYWINVINPHYTQDYIFKIIVWDNDNDRDNDRSYRITSITISIEDDDDVAPKITSISINSPIYDYMELIFLEFDATDASGIYKVEVLFTGQTYTIDYSDPHYQFIIPNPKTPGVYQLVIKVWDNDYDSWEDDRSLVVRMISITILDDDDLPPIVTYEYTGDSTDGNPGMLIFSANDASGIEGDHMVTYIVPNELGTYDFAFTATDADNDRPGDSLTTTLTVSITIVDDDENAPEIIYIYNGDGTDGNPGTVTFFATDASGIAGPATVTYAVPSELGTYDFAFTVTDADNDRPGDSLTTTSTVSITIVDDDTNPPNYLNLITHDDILNIYISFDALDNGGGDDQGISRILIFIDDELVKCYLPSDVEESFEFIISNDWITEIGGHQIIIEIWDADDDRGDDNLSVLIALSFEVTFQEMQDFVVWEIDQLIEKVQLSPDEAWEGPVENRKSTVINKLNELRDLILSDSFSEAYDKLLHDIKEKLTGLKTDENEEEWGNGVFKNAWVEDEILQEEFRLLINELLTNIQLLITNC